MIKRIFVNSLVNFGRLLATLALSMLIVIMALGLVLFVFGDTGLAIVRTLLFCAIYLGGQYGARKRQRDREQLTGRTFSR